MAPAERRIIALPGNARAWKALQPLRGTIALDGDGKGGFRATIADTLVPGLYRVTLRIRGEDSQLGRFERSETVATMVGFAEADRSRSEITLRRDPRRAAAELTLRPQDRHGNLLGPGLTSEIRATLSSDRTEHRPEDLGDGSYRICLAWKQGTDPVLEISVADRPLFKGAIGAMRTTRGKGKAGCLP